MRPGGGGRCLLRTSACLPWARHCARCHGYGRVRHRSGPTWQCRLRWETPVSQLVVYLFCWRQTRGQMPGQYRAGLRKCCGSRSRTGLGASDSE